MSKLNFAHIPVIMQHLSTESVTGFLLPRDQGVILYRLSAEDEHRVQVEAFAVVPDREGLKVDLRAEKSNNVMWIGRKEDIYADYDRGEEGPNDYDTVNKVFRDCLFDDFAVGPRLLVTHLNVAKLLES
jgi:hypothetical protein